jgi:hypothetical protein
MTNRNSKTLVDIVEKVNRAEKKIKIKSKPASPEPTFE